MPVWLSSLFVSLRSFLAVSGCEPVAHEMFGFCLDEHAPHHVDPGGGALTRLSTDTVHNDHAAQNVMVRDPSSWAQCSFLLVSL